MEGREFFAPYSMQTIFSTAMPLVILTMAQVIVLVSGNNRHLDRHHDCRS